MYGDNDGPGVDRYDSTLEYVCATDSEPECDFDGTVDVEIEHSLAFGECPKCGVGFEIVVA